MSKIKRKATLEKNRCASCGACAKICPRNAISIVGGMYANIDNEKCIGCAKCVKECPAGIITMIEQGGI